MGRIIITTESGTDLSVKRAQQLGIHIFPMHVVMGDLSREDGSFPVTEVFEYYRNTKKIPTTSAVNPQAYADYFVHLRQRYPDSDILHIAYTSLASSTWQNARTALNELGDDRIFLVDSLNVSGGISLICEKAYELAEQEERGDIVAELLKDWIARARVSFLPDTLEYLKAGGRVSNAAYLGASLLRLKPLINIEDGRLVASKKYRGSMERVSFEYLREFVETHRLDHSLFYLFYVEGFSMELLERLKKEVMLMGFQKVLVTRCGCVISCHGGPGALGLAGFAQKEV